MCTTANDLEYYSACWCGGTGCGGHRIGTLFVAQHTYTPGCDGFHEPGQCPVPDRLPEVVFSGGAVLGLSLGAAGGESPEH